MLIEELHQTNPLTHIGIRAKIVKLLNIFFLMIVLDLMASRSVKIE